MLGMKVSQGLASGFGNVLEGSETGGGDDILDQADPSLPNLEGLGKGGDDGKDEGSGVNPIPLHDLHDAGHIDRLLLLTPAIVIGGHAHGLIGQLGFTGQFGLGKTGHVDHISAPGTVHMGLCPSGEGWALHTHQSLVRVDLEGRKGLFRCGLDDLCKLFWGREVG